MVIRSYGDRPTKRFAKGDRRRLPQQLAGRIARILDDIEDASSPEDLRRDGYRVHRLSGDRKGFSAVPVSGAWRVVFRFEEGNAYDVEVVDYHRS
ncbi:MAG: type II toxin-antitoxin system RelE/ParE family toxin [Bryobacterales bacterium]|nr:type II toxin-antitoxin system RelE/ParE family toxin [Bryobacterales bacterium]